MALTFYAGKTPSTKKELYKLAWIALIYSLVFNALVVANRIGCTFGIFKPFLGVKISVLSTTFIFSALIIPLTIVAIICLIVKKSAFKEDAPAEDNGLMYGIVSWRLTFGMFRCLDVVLGTISYKSGLNILRTDRTIEYSFTSLLFVLGLIGDIIIAYGEAKYVKNRDIIAPKIEKEITPLG